MGLIGEHGADSHWFDRGQHCPEMVAGMAPGGVLDAVDLEIVRQMLPGTLAADAGVEQEWGGEEMSAAMQDVIAEFMT